jgi:D-alanyl-D-alanine dipeptidase
VIRAALICVALAACAKKAADEAPPPMPAPIDAAAAVAVPDAASVDAAPAATGPIPAASRLLLTSSSAGWKATDTALALWQRAGAGEPWTKVRAWKGSLGHAGLAWGAGLHGAGAPAGHAGPVKREGDGKSPAGVFALGDTFGYGAAPPARAATPYTQVDDHWYCVDDPASTHYNRIVDARGVGRKDWSSAEEMRRKDVQYTWVIDVAHNRDAVAERGSCIFLHVWRSPGSVTTGCTAMEETAITALLADLDPARVPVLVQLPAAEYDALAAAWQLPPRK